MMIGHGSSPKPLRRDTITSMPTTVTVGMARPMLTDERGRQLALAVVGEHDRRAARRSRPPPPARPRECQTVSHSCSRDGAAVRRGPRGR